ncbi:hypothetical protein KW796_02780 [Candidatus Parcubacteria bacterium]|nr:hypothetical protein [Candidatus Parcubacteria bacterium]
MLSKPVKLTDHENHEILASGNYIFFGDTLLIENLLGDWKLLFQFNDITSESGILATSDEATKTLNIELKGFNRNLGAVSLGKTVIWKTNDNRDISFTVKAQTKTDSKIRDMTLTFFISPPVVQAPALPLVTNTNG